MAKNKIITTQGNVQFINSKGRTINVHPWHVYSIYDADTVSFLFVGMKDYSGQAIFASQYEDLEVNGVVYDNMEDLKNAIGEAFAKSGAQARTEIVTELPEDPYTNTIYLVKKEHGDGYDEYIWNEDEGWQLIGDTDIEFERYLQIVDFNAYSAATAEDIAYISGAVDTNAADIVYLSGAVDTEIAAREAADAFISGAVDTVSANLNSEVSRAISAETALQNNINTANARIDAEQIARANADNALSAAVDTKVTSVITGANGRSLIFNESDGGGAKFEHNDGTESFVGVNDGGQNGLVAQIYADKLVGGRWQGAKLDVTNGGMYYTVGSDRFADRAVPANEVAVKGDVIAEASARTEADGVLQTAIDNETSARTAAINAEASARTATDNTLQTNIDNEASARTEADNALQTAIDTDVIASAEYDSSAVTINFMNISGDVISSIDATDFIVDGMIEDVRIENGYLIIDFNTASGIEDIEIPLTDIFNPANYYDKDAIDGIVSGINNSIADEVSARTSADTALQTAIDNEVSARTSADTALQSAIDTVSGNVASETSRAESAETALQTAINNEVSARTAAISAVEGEISGVSDSLSAYSTTVEMNAAIDAATSGKLDTSAFEIYSGDVETALSGKQDTMAAGDGITISADTISATYPGKSGFEWVEEITSDVPMVFYLSGTDETCKIYMNYGDEKYTELTFNQTAHTYSWYDFDTDYLDYMTIAFDNEADAFKFTQLASGNITSIEIVYNGFIGYEATIPSGTTTSMINTLLDDVSVLQRNINTLESELDNKQDELYVGSNISIDENTISCTLPLMGNRTSNSLRLGYDTTANNNYEVALGKYNASAKESDTFGESGNTLFSVGNGASYNDLHNAFEIRQNGDIYIQSGNTDIKLQDHLGGGGSITVSSAITQGDVNPVQGGVLYDELRINNTYYNYLEWENNDGGNTTNYPTGSGISNLTFIVVEGVNEGGWFGFIDSNENQLGYINIEISSGVVSVAGYENVTYSIIDNFVSVDYPSIAANVDHLYSSYDNHWDVYYVVTGEPTRLIDKVGYLSTVSSELQEGDEVTARALNDLYETKADASALSGYVATSNVTSAVTSGSTAVITSGGVYQQLGGLKLVSLTQIQYDNLQNKDSNTLYIISD